MKFYKWENVIVFSGWKKLIIIIRVNWIPLEGHCPIGHEWICQCLVSWNSWNSPANKVWSADCMLIWSIQFCYSVEHLWELLFKIVPVKFKGQFTSFYVILHHSSVKVTLGHFRSFQTSPMVVLGHVIHHPFTRLFRSF